MWADLRNSPWANPTRPGGQLAATFCAQINEVLVSESMTAVAYRSGRRCRVASGQWFASYSGMVVTVSWEWLHIPIPSDPRFSAAWRG